MFTVVFSHKSSATKDLVLGNLPYLLEGRPHGSKHKASWWDPLHLITTTNMQGMAMK